MAQTPPTLVSYTETVWNTTGTSKSSASVSWNAGDVIVVLIGQENDGVALGAPTATGLTFTAQQVINVGGGGRCQARLYTAVAASSGSSAVSGTSGETTQVWGFGVWVWRGSDGVGVSVQQVTATKTKALTPGAGADSAIVWGIFDFEAATVGTFTPTPTTERQRAQIGTNYTIYVANLNDQTSAAAVNYGFSGGGGTVGPYSIIAIEIKGAAGAAVARPKPPIVRLQARNRAQL